MCLIPGHLLQAGNLHNGADSLQQRVLVARAAWLVGVCGGELPPALWGEALVHLIRHMGSPDLVLALFSVSAVLSLLSVFIEQQHVSFLPPPSDKAVHVPIMQSSMHAQGVLEACLHVACRAASWLVSLRYLVLANIADDTLSQITPLLTIQ